MHRRSVFVLRRTMKLSTGLSPALSTFRGIQIDRKNGRARGLTVSRCIASNTALFSAAHGRRRTRQLSSMSLRPARSPPAPRQTATRTARGMASEQPPQVSHHPRRVRNHLLTWTPPRKNNGNQTHLPTLQSQTRAHARFPRPHEVPRRPCRDRCPSRQGTQAPGGLTPRAALACRRRRRFGMSQLLPRTGRSATVPLGACGGPLNSRPCWPLRGRRRCAAAATGCR